MGDGAWRTSSMIARHTPLGRAGSYAQPQIALLSNNSSQHTACELGCIVVAASMVAGRSSGPSPPLEGPPFLTLPLRYVRRPPPSSSGGHDLNLMVIWGGGFRKACILVISLYRSRSIMRVTIHRAWDLTKA